LFLLVIAVSHLISDETWSKWASRIEVAVFMGGILYLVITRNREVHYDKPVRDSKYHGQ